MMHPYWARELRRFIVRSSDGHDVLPIDTHDAQFCFHTNSKNDMMCISVGSDGSLKHAVSEYILRNRIEYKPKRTPSQPPLAPSVALSTANQQCAAPLGTEEGSRPSASPSR